MELGGIDAGVRPGRDHSFEAEFSDGLGQDLEPGTISVIDIKTSKADLDDGDGLEGGVKSDLNGEAAGNINIGFQRGEIPTLRQNTGTSLSTEDFPGHGGCIHGETRREDHN